ncbi:MAG: alpha-D-ribose 1-methylphosphonate 5-triphosphate diphosphatase [Brevinematales bacterium]|jgi:alpha-D-ribose 1-methylphosphonate 5-triphosphate diphosphatase
MKATKGEFSIYNANIVTPDEVIKGGSVLIEDGKISKITSEKITAAGSPGVRSVDAKGCYLMPGFIDIHSDVIEREIESRPGTFLSTNIALLELDKKLAASGVTTIYHSVSFADEIVIVIRSLDVVDSIIREIKRLRDTLLIKTKVHTRYEVTYSGGLPEIEKLMSEGLVDFISVMDHSPGQGQFKTEEQIRGYYGDRFGVDKKSILDLIDRRMALRERVGIENAVKMVKAAHASKVPVASHDDDTREKVVFMRKNGIRITEFPVSMEAVEEAAAAGIAISLGSPNILRGYSHNKNLSSRELLKEGYGDIVCSDYIPSTLVHSMFVLKESGIKTLSEACRLYNYNPAKCLGLAGECGAVSAGLDADLVLIDNNGEIPRILKTWVRGREVYSICMD